MTIEPFTLHSDDGHGWLETPVSILRELGISHSITSYSYRKGDTAYLEEDGDLDAFFDAFIAKFGNPPEFEHQRHHGLSSIRDLPAYAA